MDEIEKYAQCLWCASCSEDIYEPAPGENFRHILTDKENCADYSGVASIRYNQVVS